MALDPQEGVVKFRQEYRRAPPPSPVHLLELREWRNRLRQWELIGEYPDGIGYGNVSHRVPPYDSPPGSRPFVITGTQTGRDDYLEGAAYTTVLGYDVDQNSIACAGPVPASSESLTHSVLYDLDDSFRYVFHAHSPEIWGLRRELNLPETHPDITYGTVEMAREVQRLFGETHVAETGVFAMAGHKDGIVSFGRTPTETGSLLRIYLTRAREWGRGA